MRQVSARFPSGGVDPCEVTVVCVVFNERRRIPRLLEHHRRIGVTRFVFVDNGSVDGTLDYLCAQSDCNVFLTQDAFGDPLLGKRKWINDLAHTYALGRWCLVLDADEFFVYRDYESRPVTVLISDLERAKAGAMFSFLMDMFPGEMDGDYTDRSDPIETAPYFDADYEFSSMSGHSDRPFPDINVQGGIRHRMFVEYSRGGVWQRTRFQLAHFGTGLARHLSPKLLKWIRQRVMLTTPQLGKIPLFRCDEKFSLGYGAHFSSPSSLYVENSVLLHFKLMPDYLERLMGFETRGQHWQGGVEQRWLRQRLANSSTAGLIGPNSLKYRGSAQLVELRLIRSLSHYSSWAVVGDE